MSTVDGVAMGGALSVALSDCFMDKMEGDFVIPLKPKFYCQYVDGTYNRRNKDETEEPFERMNKYHPNISLTVEVNLSKFVDTKVHRDNNDIKCFTYHK